MRDWSYMTDALARARRAIPPGRPRLPRPHLRLAGRRGHPARHRRAVRRGDAAEIAEPLGLDGLYIGAPAERAGARRRSCSAPIAGADRDGRARRAHRRASSALLRAAHAGRPAPHRRRADARRHRGVRLGRAGDARGADPRRQRSASPPARSPSCTRRWPAAASSTACGCSRGDRLARATEVQTRRIDLVVPFPMHWRLGYHRVATTAARRRAASATTASAARAPGPTPIASWPWRWC